MKDRQSPDLETLKLWKGSSGTVQSTKLPGIQLPRTAIKIQRDSLSFFPFHLKKILGHTAIFLTFDEHPEKSWEMEIFDQDEGRAPDGAGGAAVLSLLWKKKEKAGREKKISFFPFYWMSRVRMVRSIAETTPYDPTDPFSF